MLSGEQTYPIIGFFENDATSTSEVKKSLDILDKLRGSLAEDISEHWEDFRELCDLVGKNKEVKNEVEKKIKSTIPHEIQSGTVASYLYSHANSNLSDSDHESPVNFFYIPKYKTPVYEKTSKGLRKLNKIEAAEAVVFTSEVFENFSESEEQTLAKDGISEVTIMQTKNGKCSVSKRFSISSESETRSDSTQSQGSCASKQSSPSVSFDETVSKRTISQKGVKDSHCPLKDSEKSCDVKSEKSSSWGFILAVAVLILLVIAFVCFWIFSSSSFSKASSVEKNVANRDNQMMWL